MRKLEVFGDSMVMFIDDSAQKKYNLLDKIMDQSLLMTGLFY